MIAVLKVFDEFRHSENVEILAKNKLLMMEKFEDLNVEFFYFVRASMKNAYFIVRIVTKDREAFKDAIGDFAENMNFTILDRDYSKIILQQSPPLDEYF